ncbi:MAG: DNA-processing protein DprA, partial [Waddliaceae bacterium]
TIIQHWGWWESDFSWEKNLDLTKRLDVQIIPYTSPSYPRRLLELPDHPILLYVMGDLRGADQHSIAVVGTRRASVYGLEMAEKISRDLAAYGYTVVSGLARGIDTAAHQGALKKGRTVAVIGSGLANIYPKENLELAKHITNKGALISEYPMTTPPDRQNFPQRNRIVSGITMGSLLVEAPERSGAMITMNKAWGQGKKLFALPGRIGTNFCGNHQLIKQGKAQLIESAAEIDQDFGNLFNLNAKNTKSKDSYPPLDKEEKMLLNHLPNEPFAIEELVKITDLPIIKLNILLLSLVVKKVINECPGKFYRKAW